MSSKQDQNPQAQIATIRICPLEAGRAHFVLFSQRGRLLLRSAPVPAEQMHESIDEFQRHCGIRSYYRVRASGQGWVIELRSSQGRLLAVSGNTLVDERLADITVQLSVQQGPFAQVLQRQLAAARPRSQVDDESMVA